MKFKINRNDIETLYKNLGIVEDCNQGWDIELTPEPNTAIEAMMIEDIKRKGYSQGYENGYKNGLYDGMRKEGLIGYLQGKDKQSVSPNGIQMCACGFVGSISVEHKCKDSITVDGVIVNN